MAKSNALKMKLPSVDDLFSTEEQRQEAKLAKIYDIPLSEITVQQQIFTENSFYSLLRANFH